MVELFEGARKNWKSVLKFLVFSAVFWGLEFAYQYYYSVPGMLPNAIVRSFAYSGATFVALALLSSVVFKFVPRLAVHWPTRRNLGVVGTFFIIFHVFAALNFYFNFNLEMAYFSLNPFVNPLVFGALALPIFLLVTIVSTDWAMQKLGAKWKAIQRLVYIGYMFVIFHFAEMQASGLNPTAFEGPAWYLLQITTILAVLGELYWFLRITYERKKFTIGTAIGAGIILLYIILSYLAFFAK